MSRRVERDAGTLTAGERMLGEGSSTGSCQDLMEGKLKESEKLVYGSVWLCADPVSPSESD